ALANDAAIAGRIRRSGGENCHRGTLFEMQVSNSHNCFRADKGYITGEDEQISVLRQRLAPTLDCVSRPFLLRLQDELNAGCADCFPHPLCLMSNNHEYSVR